MLVRFNDAPQFDIRGWDANDRLVAPDGADDAVAQVMTTRLITLAESMTAATHWEQTSAGSDHATAGRSRSSPVMFADATVQSS